MNKIYPWCVVILLMMAFVLSFLDRQILNLMVGPMRADLGISDTQMSLLMGLSFAVFYTVCGIPIARLADRSNRRLLITVGVAAWSFATLACGLAQRYWHLLLGRIGVGVGESTLTPAAYSLISDYFPREQRATAISVFGVGMYIGSGLAYALGGAVVHYASNTDTLLLPLLGEVRPWQMVFLILGAAGIAFSPVLLLIREPLRSVDQGKGMPLSAVVTAWRTNARTLLCHHFGFGIMSIATYGSAAWIPSYFIRVHNWTVLETGLVYGCLVGIFGTIGIVFGGRWADRLVRQGMEDATLRVAMTGALLGTPCLIALLTVSHYWLIIVLLAVCVFLLSMPFGVAAAGLQEVVPPAMRAQASAIYMLVVNLIGLGLGPTAIALITDYVFADDMAVGQSILIACVAALLLGALLLRLGLASFRTSCIQQRLATEID